MDAGAPLRALPIADGISPPQPRSTTFNHANAHGPLQNTSHLIKLEQLDLRVQVGRWDHVREINRHPKITCSIGSRDHAAVLANELPEGKNQLSHRLTIEDEGLHPNLGLPVVEHVVDYRVDVAAVDIDMSSGPEAGLKQGVDGAAITIDDVGEILLARRIASAFLDGVDHHDLHQKRSDAEAACRRVNHQATNLGLGGRFVSARCQLNDSGAEDVFGGPVDDVKQPMLPCCIAENMRRTIEKCSLVQRLDEGERKPVFGLTRQSDLDPVLIPDHWRSMDHLAAPRLQGD
jgi:hypothetical protein